MKTSLIAAALLILGSAGQALAADAGRLPTTCPVRDRGEARAAYGGRAHDYCEVRWRDLVATHRTGGQTHEHYIDVCARKCIGDAYTSASLTGGPFVLGYTAVALAGLGEVVSSGPNNQSPASP